MLNRTEAEFKKLGFQQRQYQCYCKRRDNILRTILKYKQQKTKAVRQCLSNQDITERTITENTPTIDQYEKLFTKKMQGEINMFNKVFYKQLGIEEMQNNYKKIQEEKQRKSQDQILAIMKQK